MDLPAEELKRIEEAKTCHSCLDWHKHCHAECCKVFSVTSKQQDFSKHLLNVVINLTLDEKEYFRLRGCKYGHGLLRVPTKFCTVVNDKIWVVNRCSKLKGNLCTGHPLDKPKLCLALFDGCDLKGFEITPNCLYKYKNPELVRELNVIVPDEVNVLFDKLKEE